MRIDEESFEEGRLSAGVAKEIFQAVHRNAMPGRWESAVREFQST
jgi:hypothetical protein